MSGSGSAGDGQGPTERQAPQNVVTTKKIVELRAGNIEIARSEPVPSIDVTECEDRLKENSWRRRAIGLMLAAFVTLNFAVFFFIYIVWKSEFAQPVANRIVTERVILALIAGSVAQLGALALGLGRALAQRNT
jgi:hypothetical protein